MSQKRMKKYYCVQLTGKLVALMSQISWKLVLQVPNATKILTKSNTQSLHIMLGNQTVGLNIMNRLSAELPNGIYHCEMMDRNNNTHHLYAGIYPEDEGTCIM